MVSDKTITHEVVFSVTECITFSSKILSKLSDLKVNHVTEEDVSNNSLVLSHFSVI